MPQDKLKLEYKKEVVEIPLSKIETNNFNPRKGFVQTEEEELIQSLS